MRIITSVEWPIYLTHPIWIAIDDSTYDLDASAMGVGKTEKEAIDDLIWQIEGDAD